MQVIATSYSVLVDSELGNRARNLLQSGGAEQPAAPASGWTPPAQPQHPSDPPPAPPAGAPPAAPAPGEERPPAPPA
jgi:hypothetical protein